MSDKLCVRMWPCVQVGSEFLISEKIKAGCDSPWARGAEGHLPRLWHAAHGVTVTLWPEEKLIVLPKSQ